VSAVAYLAPPQLKSDVRGGRVRRSGGANASMAVPASVQHVLGSAGQPLSDSLQTEMSARFGHDFSGVRVHTEPAANESVQAVGARAYTVGSHIAFGPAQFTTSTVAGQRLLAHELAHVVQQSGASTSVPPELHVTSPDDPSEAEAERVALSVLSDRDVVPVAAAGIGVRLARGGCSGTPSGPPRCSGAGPCTHTSGECRLPDSGAPLEGPSNRWTLNLHIDIEAATAREVTPSTPGHTWVEFVEGNGNTYTYGFYPARMVTEFSFVVPSCVRHPDTAHMPCKDRTVSYALTQKQFSEALDFAQSLCAGHESLTYDIRNQNCTTVAAAVVRKAGQAPGNIRGPVGSFNLDCDNPNALFEATNPDAGVRAPADAGVRTPPRRP